LDEATLSSMSDHVREGLLGVFLDGYQVGPAGVGYRTVVVPGPPTAMNLPRTRGEINPEHAKLIVEHFELHAGGLPIIDGWRKWYREGGPCDPRSTTGHMSLGGYRAMLSREAYTGRLKIGATRRRWDSAKNRYMQIPVPADQITRIVREDLRIVSDELFQRVQKQLPPRGFRRPRKPIVHTVADLVTDVYFCAVCSCRFHMIVNREHALAAICDALAKLLVADTALMDAIVTTVPTVAEDSDGPDRVADYQQLIRQFAAKIRELEEQTGQGNEEDRRQRKAAIRAAQTERESVQRQLAALVSRGHHGREQPLTRDDVLRHVGELRQLFEDLSQGKLPGHAIDVAADLYRRLVGGKIVITPEPRPGKVRWMVKATFTPQIFSICQASLLPMVNASTGSPELPVEVRIRKIAKIDRFADEVQHMYDIQKLGFRVIGNMLEAKYGQKVGSGACCIAYRRYFEIRGLPVPPRRPSSRPRP
jgi:hypothetical protein